MTAAPPLPERLSVALVSRFFDPHVRGAEVMIQRLGVALAGADVPCDIITTRIMPDLPRKRVEGRITVRRLWTPGPSSRLSRPVEFVRAFVHMARHGGRFTIVHSDCLSAFALGAVLGGRIRGARTIVGLCTPEPGGDISRVVTPRGGGLLWRLFRRADVMAVRGPSGVAELARFGWPRQRIVQLPPVVHVSPSPLRDPARRSAARSDLGLADRPTILYVGRLSEEKGTDVLLEAWAAVRAKRPVSLVLLGTGRLAERAQQLASTDPDGCLVVAGVRSDVERWSEAADVFAFPSRSETFGLALAEAMGRGMAVVASPTGFVADGFEDGVHGRVTPIGDARGLAAILDELLADETMRTALGRAAHAYVAARFAPQVVLAAHLALYRRLLSETPSR